MEVLANAALTDWAVSFPTAERHCDNIGANYGTRVFWRGTRGRTCKEHWINNSNFYYSKKHAKKKKKKTEPLCSDLLLSWACWHHQWVSDQSSELKKHRARSVYYQLHILYAMRRHKHPDKEAHKSHNHQKAIFEAAKDGEDWRKQICHQQEAANE